MDSQKDLLNSRDEIEFLPVNTEDESPEGSEEDMNDEEYDPERNRSLTPLQGQAVETFRTNTFKNRLSIFLSIFNLMNVMVGSGFLGLSEAVKYLGIVPFACLLFGTACLALLNINFLLHTSEVAGRKTYEGLAEMLFGIRGKFFTSVMIILHCLGVLVAYTFIVKNELPEIIKALVNYQQVPGEPTPYYLTGEFIITFVLLGIIIPLSALKNIRFLGYSSAFALLGVLFLIITVIVKKFHIPCPAPLLEDENGTAILSSSLEIESNQTCEPKFFAFSARTAYAFPTMLLSFMCHASMLPIYAELRRFNANLQFWYRYCTGILFCVVSLKLIYCIINGVSRDFNENAAALTATVTGCLYGAGISVPTVTRPTIKKMQKVANASIFTVFSLYVSAALCGYLTFYNNVQSELLLSYSLYNSKDGMILVARMMLVLCLTLSTPLLHYPARKTIILTFFKNPHHFSWCRHIGVMIFNYAITAILVFFVPNIRDYFGLAGATFSGSLFFLFPPAFFIKMVRDTPKSDVRSKYRKRQKHAWVVLILGFILLTLSTILVMVDWFSKEH